MRFTRQTKTRRGVVAVEAAITMPLLLVLMLGVWEVGRIIQIQQMLVNSCREGARFAAGGYTNGTPVTNAMVQQAVRDYLTSAGFPTVAVSNAQVSLSCLSSPTWTDPYQALPLDKFQVSVVIPSGTAFNSLRWTLLNQITSVRSLSASVNWMSLNNTQIVVNTQLPY